MEHTKGPWIFGKTDEGKRIILGGASGGRYVCNVQIHQTPRHMGLMDEPEREANARLIAASPEMLATLKSMRRTLLTLGGDPMPTLDAVIAKAEGE